MKKILLLSAVAGLILASCAGNPDGKKAETSDSIETTTTTAEGESYAVDPAASQVVWTGTKVTGSHTGTVAIKSGALTVDQGAVTGGSFVLDVNSINSTDLEGEWKEKLDGHLKSEDFFDTTTFPEAKFEITAVEAAETEGDMKVSGNLTIRDITKNITFDAKATELTDTTAKLEADFNIAREDWGVNYSGKEDDLISKEINFKITLVAQK